MSFLSTRAPVIDSVAHLTLPVGDLDHAERFYIGLLGARLVARFDREAFLRHAPARAHEVDADNSPLHLAIKFGDSPEIDLFLQPGLLRRSPASHPHLALCVSPDALDAFCVRLRDACVPYDGPRRLGGPGHASVYFADPWGQLLELAATGYRGEIELGPPEAARLGHAWPEPV